MRYGTLPGLDVDFVQDNHSHSKRGVLRGLHLQKEHPQGKLVSVLAGCVWDVAADVDPQSPSFRRWVAWSSAPPTTSNSTSLRATHTDSAFCRRRPT